MKKKYTPYKDPRFYPGAYLNEDRVAYLKSLRVSLEELTIDDIVHSLSSSITDTLYLLLGIVRDMFGEEKTQEVARQVGYRLGKEMYRTQLERHKVKSLTPELMSMYQDLGHTLLGSNMAHAISTYDSEKCEVKRSRCGFHTGHPEGMGHYCLKIDDGFLAAYMEVDPNLEAKLVKAMPKGDAFCHHIFRYKK